MQIHDGNRFSAVVLVDNDQNRDAVFPRLAGQTLHFFLAAAEFVCALFGLQPEACEVAEVVKVQATNFAFVTQLVFMRSMLRLVVGLVARLMVWAMFRVMAWASTVAAARSTTKLAAQTGDASSELRDVAQQDGIPAVLERNGGDDSLQGGIGALIDRQDLLRSFDLDRKLESS